MLELQTKRCCIETELLLDTDKIYSTSNAKCWSRNSRPSIVTILLCVCRNSIFANLPAFCNEVRSYCPARRWRSRRTCLRPRSRSNPVQSALDTATLSVLCQTTVRAAEYISTRSTGADYAALNICAVGKKKPSKLKLAALSLISAFHLTDCASRL